MNYNAGNNGYRNAIEDDGDIVTANPTTGFCALVADTYYFPIGGTNAVTPAETALVSAHAMWNAAFAGTITVETSNAPKHFNGADNGPVHVSDFEAATTSGAWTPENPSTAIVGVVGSGNSATAATVTAGGSAIGGAMFHLGNLGSRRIRIKVVCSTPGNFRLCVHGKMGS